MRTTVVRMMLLIGIGCAGCDRSALASPPSSVDAGSLLIEGVPHIQQKPDFCGEACVAMVLGGMNRTGDQDWVFDQSGLDPALGRGVYAKELALALKRIGFDAPHPYKPAVTARQVQAELDAMVADLEQGIPSIVCMHFEDAPRTTEHFRLVLGFDREVDEMIYHEPAEADGAYRRMPRKLFEKLWPLGPDDARVVIRFALRYGALREGFAATTPTSADYAQRVMKLKTHLPRGFTIAVSPPFVVIGNSPPKTVLRHARRTVQQTVERLKRDYFARDPDEIIDVWLFRDGPSYRRYARELFGHTPDTPYGYFTSEFNALVMNIGTGGGTLVHEIVHPFMSANFPDCPPWFNEGLASLYECSTTRDGRIWGLTNWRLTGLKREIRRDGLPSFAVLMAKDEDQFYNDSAGDNYAQSRYLLQYLQERGMLREYYHAFLANRATDPTGYNTLKAMLNIEDMDAFKKKWQRWVMALER